MNPEREQVRKEGFPKHGCDLLEGSQALAVIAAAYILAVTLKPQKSTKKSFLSSAGTWFRSYPG